LIDGAAHSQHAAQVCPEALVSVHMPPLVKLLNRCSRDVCANAQNGQMHQAHYQQVAKLNRCVC
jgi:hypothetical protein